MTDDLDENMGFPTATDRFFGDAVGGRRLWASEWEREHDWHHHVTGYKDAADVLLAHLENADGTRGSLGPKSSSCIVITLNSRSSSWRANVEDSWVGR